ncbi:hypothetical protein LXM25_11430 [Dyadobacter sp. LJ53]|uniref:hypothetical protein n=1 Tax=Dyadobacter chenwenxiniae TaxID=2906456 RepID=UPI001F44EE4C|nr:hypothetical protein [Dyadobacter chenwenxiniae]MCF0050674.1 hypothetical protein [Dyadobacter chenwenxiniae]
MKNFILTAAYVILSFFLFCCNEPDPQPSSAQGAEYMAEAQSVPVTAAMQIGGDPTTDRPPLRSKFEWKLMTTATLPYKKGLKLTAPFAVVNEDAGDISWGRYYGCYDELKALTMPFAELGVVDVKTVTTESLKTKTYYKSWISTAPANSTFWENEMPDGAVLAFKDSKGKFALVKIKSTYPLVLELYFEHYYTIY